MGVMYRLFKSEDSLLENANAHVSADNFLHV